MSEDYATPGTAPSKSLEDRAHELLHIFLGVGIRPGEGMGDGEELAREAVRWCRAMDDEVRKPTLRPEPQKKRPVTQRGVPPQPEEEEEWG